MATLIGAFNTWAGWWAYLTTTLQRGEEQASAWRDQYNFLQAYYLNNSLYTVLSTSFAQLGYSSEALKPLRNPAYRVVEFYAAKLWPGMLPQALPMIADNRRIQEPIQQVWKWSNWGSEEQAVARSFPEYGDLFLKVATRSDEGKVSRVYLQNLAPQSITDFDSDERGYVTYIRIDIPQQRRQEDGRMENYTLTEVWDKDTQLFRRWEHKKNLDAQISQLGQPATEKAFSDFGIDFVPIVWQPFRHIGQERGMAAITPAIDKIDEANRQATRLHQILFRYNKPLWAASAGGADASGRPLPPPRLTGSDGSTLTRTDDPDGDDIVRLPGTAKLDSLVPNLNYDSALAVLNDHMKELSHDLPEMVYAEIREQPDLSGVAIRYLLEAAIDRLREARGNAESALSRANAMALTIGQATGLFRNLGTYEAGDFDHTFAERPVLTAPELERAQIVQTYTGAGVPLPIAAKKAGWNEDEVNELNTAVEKEQAAMDTTTPVAVAQRLRMTANGKPQRANGVQPR